MEWSRKKEQFFNILGTHLRNLSSNRSKNRNSYLTYDSHVRIPIIINTINVTQASTQTISIDWNNNNAEEFRKNRRRKYQHRFNKCLAELVEKYPPIPAHEYLKEDDQINSSIWSKFLQSREDLLKLNKILEDLDKRLECLSLNICSKCIISTDI